MPGTTRELNVKVISMVTLVSVILLTAIIFAAQAGFFFFKNRQEDRQYSAGAARTFAETGSRHDNLDLARLDQEQDNELQRTGRVDVTDDKGKVIGRVEMTPINDAMKRIAERY